MDNQPLSSLPRPFAYPLFSFSFSSCEWLNPPPSTLSVGCIETPLSPYPSIFSSYSSPNPEPNTKILLAKVCQECKKRPIQNIKQNKCFTYCNKPYKHKYKQSNPNFKISNTKKQKNYKTNLLSLLLSSLSPPHLFLPPLTFPHLPLPLFISSRLFSPPLTSSCLHLLPLASSYLLSPSLTFSHLLLPLLTSPRFP
jgi:hypothetical protein